MPIRILIVEDDKHDRRILESLLTQELAALAPELIVAPDGQDALKALERGPFSLIISDLLMPRMDGFAFARALRQHPHGANAPLIVTSAHYKDSASQHRLRGEAGAFQFFAKPFDLRELLTAVQRAVGDLPAPTVATAAPVIRGGQLVDAGPPHVLLDLAEESATGTVTFQRGNAQKSIAVVGGNPVSADSNLRNETLGHFLVARGVLDEARHQAALTKAQASEARLGRALIDLGWLSERDLLHHLAAQMRARVTSMLRWGDGDWSFAPGPPPADRLQTPLEMARLVFLGLQKTARVDVIAPVLTGVQGRLRLTARADRHHDAFARIFGTAGLEILSRRPPVGELLAGADSDAMLVQIDVLMQSGLCELEIDEQPASAGSTVPPPSAPTPTERNAASPPARAAAAPPLKSPANPLPKNLYDELFGEESSDVRARQPASEGQEPPARSAAPREAVTTDAIPGARPGATIARIVPKPDAVAEALRKELLAAYLAAPAQDHYQLLGVARDAAPDQIAAAHAAMLHRFRAERFVGVDLGRDLAKLDSLHQAFHMAFEALSQTGVRTDYDRHLQAQKRNSREALNAELLAQEAHKRLAQGDGVAAESMMEEAVAAVPDEPAYHALRGWAAFIARGGATARTPTEVQPAAGAAWLHLTLALSLDADHADAHEFAGRIAVAAGDEERAIEHLERALDADGRRDQALAALEVALGRRGEWQRLEHWYRKLIDDAGDQGDPVRLAAWWWRLGELYRERLDDRKSARVAYEMVAQHAPTDARPREMLSRLQADGAGAWRSDAHALLIGWLQPPGDLACAQTLLRLHLEAQRWDAAWLTAASLVARGEADAAAVELHARYRPRFLQRAQALPSADRRAALRHPDDDPDLGLIFARLLAAVPLVSPSEIPIDELAATPEPLARVISYCAALLGMDPPKVQRRDDLGAEIRPAIVGPPALWAGPQALAETDRPALAFRVARALSALATGRAAAITLPSRPLKEILLAGLSLVTPDLRADDPDGAIAQRRAQLLAAAPSLSNDLAAPIERLHKTQQGSLNLSRYLRGVQRTGDRWGLLACNDPGLALPLAVDGGGADELLMFALSDEYLALRDALGLSVEV